MTSTPFNVAVGTASQLAFTTEPGNGTGGTALTTQPTVTIEDAGGNTVTTDTHAVTMAIGTNPSAGTLSTCTSTTTAGVAAFTGCTINKTGTGYTLTATDTLDAGITHTSTTFNVTVGAASQLAFTTQPGNGTGGTALAPQPAVTIRGRRRQHGHDRHARDHHGHRHQPVRRHAVDLYVDDDERSRRLHRLRHQQQPARATR